MNATTAREWTNKTRMSHQHKNGRNAHEYNNYKRLAQQRKNETRDGNNRPKMEQQI